MSSAQMANYLQDLRTNRPARPNGSRPPPAQFSTWSSRTSSRYVASPAVSPFSQITFKEAGVDVDAIPPPVPVPAAEPQYKTHLRKTSNMSIDEVLATGRPLVQPPRGRDISRSTVRDRTPSVTYRENGQRRVEREEARALRIAMEELDLKEERNLYNAARDEAADLVWKHQNPNAPGVNPDAPYSYPGLAERGNHQRSRSLGRGEDLQLSQSKLRKRNSTGNSASGSRSSSLQSHRTASGESVTANADLSSPPSKNDSGIGSKPEALASLPDNTSNIVDPKQRRRSSGSRRKISASLFKNPGDQIYEEPEEEAQSPAITNPSAPAKLPLQMRRNPFSRVQFAKDMNLVRANTDPAMSIKRFDRYEIQNNPPSQSRNAGYMSNMPLNTSMEGQKLEAEHEAEVRMKDGKEIRSDDIRAATSMRLKDRSAKLPTPTVVSDSPGRPIVSFQNDWKPKEVELKQEMSVLPQSVPRPADQILAAPQHFSKAATSPVIPTINIPDDAARTSAVSSSAPTPQLKVAPPSPSIRVGRGQAPVIQIYEDPPARRPFNASTSRKVNTPQSSTPPIPTISVSQATSARSKSTPAPSIPTITVQETPSISVTPADRNQSVKAPSISATQPIPTISVNETPTSPSGPKVNAPSISVTPSEPANINGPASSTRPLPCPKDSSSKPLPRSNAAGSRSHRTLTTVRTGALCTHCALPIAGRIVSAAGSRFHPECFLCHHCGEHLECVAFYPEPDNKRAERIARIQARMRGDDIEFLPTHPTPADMQRLEQEDGDEGMRFYCHLDFHELFSPRCKSCKTPIEGEVVVACGAEWHVGHFFCAQCGDPFDSKTPFVEKDGYAWCVDCHTNRYSTKCKKCRRPVTDTVVKALGAEWHVGCFCCVECSGPFNDGRYFLRGDSQDPVCVRCEEKRLKA
ncbi:hypothetical protein CC78DRAFT_513003 [Lojkania enalia]|uniref:LIM zinc-binding domain-containing protein n=1 Tax=Lojkania enalia TaxID=147567 RepID=A0A9P4KFP2_9PLEO|nr:hypothetical protein CC78DRAFT_513003 [Didymosphaeria enalia]